MRVKAESPQPPPWMFLRQLSLPSTSRGLKRSTASGFPSAFQSYTPNTHCIPSHSYGTIVLTEAGEIAVVYGHESQKWSLPKGHGQGSHETPHEAAIRETLEEVGLDLAGKKPVD